MHTLYLIIDTSKSMSSPRLFSALCETIQKIQNNLIQFPAKGISLTSLVVIQSGQDKNEIIKNTSNLNEFATWLPKVEECAGVAPIVKCLTDMVLPMLAASVRESIIIISDGYWCGSEAQVKDFEFYCLKDNLCSLIEININNDVVYNFTNSKSTTLYAADENLVNKIVEQLRK